MLIQVPEMLWPPISSLSVTYNATAAAARLNASGARVTTVINVPASMNKKIVTNIGWRTGTVATSETIRIGLYTTSSGLPTSSTYGGSTYATRASLASATYYEETLSTGATLASGDQVAVVWEPDNFSAMSLYVGVSYYPIQSAPGISQYVPTTWTYNAAYAISYYLKTSTGDYVPVSNSPPNNCGFESLTSSTATTEVGNCFVVPFACRVIGFWSNHATTAATSTFSMNLYGGVGGALLASQTVLGGYYTWPSSPSGYPVLLYFANPVVLSAGSQVTVTVKPLAAVNVQLGYFTLAAAGEETAYRSPRGGTWIAKTSGVWTPTATRLGRIGLILDQIDNGIRYRGRRGN